MTHRIVVLGAGYAGQLAAKLAARRTGAHVTLLNAQDRFVERVRLHQLAAGQPLREVRIRELLDGTDVELVVDRVTGIDAAQRTVQLAQAKRTVPYDTLVYVLGSQATPAASPGQPCTRTRLRDPRRHRPCGTGCTSRRWSRSSVAG